MVLKAKTKGPTLYYVFKHFDSLSVSIPQWFIDNGIKKGFGHLWLGSNYSALALDADTAKFVLKSEDVTKELNFGAKIMKENFGSHLVSADGQDWKRQKAVVQSGFAHKAYESYFPTFKQLTNKVIDLMAKESESNNGETNVANWLQKFTLDILGRTVFNYDFKNLDNGNDVCYEAYKFIFGPGSKYIRFFPFLQYLPFLEFTKKLHRSVDILKSKFNEVIETHRKLNTYDDILGHMLQSADDPVSGLTPVELISNVWIFFVAGHETTSTALQWELYELSQHQDMQQRIYDEVKSILGDRTEITFDDLPKFEYLDCFIHETLRLRPPVGVLPTRKTTKEIKYGDQVIPKNSLIGISISNVHMNPEYWPEPEKFNPERFFPENRKGRHAFAFLPFSLGPRQCIGNNFSLIEQRLFLSSLLLKSKVLPSKDQYDPNLAIGFGYRPKQFHVKLVPRN